MKLTNRIITSLSLRVAHLRAAGFPRIALGWLGSMLVGVGLITSLLLPTNVHAASASLYLSPASKNINNGQTFSVQVRVRTGGDPVNAVQANLSYPDNMLSCLGVSAAGSAFDVTAQNGCGGGSIQIARGAISPANGDALVATISFQARVESGNADVLFSGGSAVVRSTDNIDILTGTNGGRYTFYTYVAPSTPASPAVPARDTTGPIITNIKVVDITPNSATITWTTDEPANSLVDFGLNTDYGLNGSSGELVTEHRIILSSVFMEVATPYRFKIRSADAAGNTTASSDQGFTTIGYGVDVTVLDYLSRPVSQAKVTLEDIVKYTGKDGQAHFVNLRPGKHILAADADGRTSFSKIEITPTKNKEGKLISQSFSIKLPRVPTYIWELIALALLAAIIGAVLLYIDLRHNYRFLKKVKNKLSRKKTDSIPPTV